MKIYQCHSCNRRVNFDNLACSCGVQLVYDPTADMMISDSALCLNRQVIGCNWTAFQDGKLCHSCAMTQTHPDIALADNVNLWARAEAAKRWVLVNLMSWGWCTPSDPGKLPTFDLLSEKTAAGQSKPVMGHANGHIVINIAESDPVTITRRREQFGEPYRTLIGHYRHELSHYLFERLSKHTEFAVAFRDLFGDERSDYSAALGQYYDCGPAAGWQDTFITEYASAHPHEDWAESSAHALHLFDVLDSAAAVNLTTPPETDIDSSLTAAFDLTLAINHLNRSMGLDDIYPFVVPPAVREKLAFAYGHLQAGPRHPSDPMRPPQTGVPA